MVSSASPFCDLRRRSALASVPFMGSVTSWSLV